jgi:hypothetical protein
MSKGKNGGESHTHTVATGLEQCENCERLYNRLVNDRCPYCPTPD